MVMIAACLVSALAMLGKANVLPIEVLYSDVSTTIYYRLYEEGGFYRLLYAAGAPSGRRRESFALTIEMYSVNEDDLKALQEDLSRSPISWNARDYWLRHDESGPRIPYNGVISVGSYRVIAPGIGAPVTSEQSRASKRAAEFVAVLDRLRGAGRIEKRLDVRRVLTEALLNLLQVVPANMLSGSQTPPSREENKDALAGSSVRACVAEMLVLGGLLAEPLQSRHPEVRLEGVSYYEAKLPEVDAYNALVAALEDPAVSVRIQAASALAWVVYEGDKAILTRLQKLACDRALMPMNDRLRAILKARELIGECAESRPK